MRTHTTPNATSGSPTVPEPRACLAASARSLSSAGSSTHRQPPPPPPPPRPPRTHCVCASSPSWGASAAGSAVQYSVSALSKRSQQGGCTTTCAAQRHAIGCGTHLSSSSKHDCATRRRLGCAAARRLRRWGTGCCAGQGRGQCALCNTAGAARGACLTRLRTRCLSAVTTCGSAAAGEARVGRGCQPGAPYSTPLLRTSLRRLRPPRTRCSFSSSSGSLLSEDAAWRLLQPPVACALRDMLALDTLA